jgi:hypothetical protein
MCDALDGHAMAGHLELKESMGTRRKKKWWRRRSKGLVNSKIKGVVLKIACVGRDMGYDMA